MPPRAATKAAMPDRASVTDYKFSLVWAVVSLRADTAPYNKITSNMNQTKLLFLLITALAFASCRQTARQTVADAEQPTDSTEAVTSADTLRLVIIDKSISRSDSVVQARIINPNDYDVNYGQEYTIERETDGHWQQVPFPKNFGFTSVLSTIAAHDSATVYGHIRLLHLATGHYRLTKQIDGRTLSDDFYIPSTITFPTPVYR